MRIFFLSLLLLFTTLLSGCGKTEASTHTEQAPENGAQFRKGEGLSLTNEMKQAIRLQLVEVGEEKIAATFNVSLRALRGGGASNEMTGWLTERQAAIVKPGMQMELNVSGAVPPAQGTVIRVEKALYAALGDYEMFVTAGNPLPQSVSVTATFRSPEGDAVAAIPRSALLKTAEGTFVYTVNGKFYLRTPVKVGAMNERSVEIMDGLYSGDEIVASPVMSLWMAELQVLRGGKACTCGH
ncbi:MAG TPA: hypothetical protein VGE29_08990 [Prosthecobacter sp.]